MGEVKRGIFTPDETDFEYKRLVSKLLGVPMAKDNKHGGVQPRNYWHLCGTVPRRIYTAFFNLKRGLTGDMMERVFMARVYDSNEWGASYSSNKTIAKNLGVSEKTVALAGEALNMMDFIRTEPKPEKGKKPSGVVAVHYINLVLVSCFSWKKDSYTEDTSPDEPAETIEEDTTTVNLANVIQPKPEPVQPPRPVYKSANKKPYQAKPPYQKKGIGEASGLRYEQNSDEVVEKAMKDYVKL